MTEDEKRWQVAEEWATKMEARLAKLESEVSGLHAERDDWLNAMARLSKQAKACHSNWRAILKRAQENGDDDFRLDIF